MSGGQPSDPVWEYRPGPHWAVVGRTAAAMLVGESTLELAEQMWDLLAEPDGAVDRVLDHLVRTGLAGLPSFALVELDGGDVRAVVRGAVSAVVGTDGDAVRALDGAGVRSWREELVTGTATVVLSATDGASPAAGPRLPIRGGVVQVQDLSLGRGGSGAHEHRATPAEPESAPTPEPAPEPTPEPEDPAMTLDGSVYDDGSHVVPAPLPAEPDVPRTDEELDDPYLDMVMGMTTMDAAPGTPAGGPPPSRPEPQPVPTQQPLPTSQPVPTPTPTPEPERPRHVAPESLSRPPAPAPRGAGAPGLISSFPFGSSGSGVRRSSPSPSPSPSPPPVPPVTRDRRPAPPAPVEEDEGDVTIVRVSAGEAPVGGGRTGLAAVVCPAGHAGPPESERCRVCGADLSSAQQQWVERPVLGRLRFDGEPGIVPVTGPVIIGRGPRADGVPGNAVPTMVRVPGKEVSRSHVRIAVEGWHVVAVDLGTTNGTWVYDPDGEGRRLGADEERTLVPGSRVVLSEDVSFVFEVQP